MMKVNCPTCSNSYQIPFNKEEVVGATTDCEHCGSLLLITKEGTVDFHKYLHEQDPLWPADGKNTGSIEVK